MISLRFLGSDEISSKSIHLEGRIMAVVPATAVAANVSTGRMKVVLLLVPRPPLPSFLFYGSRVSERTSGICTRTSVQVAIGLFPIDSVRGEFLSSFSFLSFPP